MQALEIAKTAYKRGSAQIPPVRVENVYYEPSPVSSSGGVWITRPALERYSAGLGALRGLYRKDGVLNGDLFIATANKLYRYTQAGVITEICNLSGSGLISIAGNLSGLMIADGVNLQYYNGTTCVFVATPFIKPVWVGYMAGFWLCVPENSFKRYWSNDTDPLTWGGLDFDAAVSEPDNLICSFVLNNRIWDIGQKTIEFRYASGEADAPFYIEQGRGYNRGCYTKNSVVALDNTLIWLGEDKILYRGAEIPVAISDAFFSEKIDKVAKAEIFAFGFSWQGHVFYLITIGNEGTFAYDLTTQKWAEWKTINRDNWVAAIICEGWDHNPILGNIDTGVLYQLNADKFNDDGQEIVTKVTIGAPLERNRPIVYNLTLEVRTGEALSSSGEGKVWVKTSKDGGRTYGDSITRDLGVIGEYSKRIRFTRLGQFTPPLFVAEVSISDNVPHTIENAYINSDF